ncbi:hypothetical protein KP509_13G070000 [Ceratopteris richardii]|uniref:Uncharacterized protein n=1 Tax=Ceratopteris richardii TaxID=49495 RepID=A0A8T2TJV9_CERRI|nr:hypothetical protein KP509_13G070000 [Ceratopteris richardii]
MKMQEDKNLYRENRALTVSVDVALALPILLDPTLGQAITVNHGAPPEAMSSEIADLTRLPTAAQYGDSTISPLREPLDDSIWAITLHQHDVAMMSDTRSTRLSALPSYKPLILLADAPLILLRYGFPNCDLDVSLLSLLFVGTVIPIHQLVAELFQLKTFFPF